MCATNSCVFKFGNCTYGFKMAATLLWKNINYESFLLDLAIYVRARILITIGTSCNIYLKLCRLFLKCFSCCLCWFYKWQVSPRVGRDPIELKLFQGEFRSDNVKGFFYVILKVALKFENLSKVCSKILRIHNFQ